MGKRHIGTRAAVWLVSRSIRTGYREAATEDGSPAYELQVSYRWFSPVTLVLAAALFVLPDW